MQRHMILWQGSFHFLSLLLRSLPAHFSTVKIQSLNVDYKFKKQITLYVLANITQSWVNSKSAGELFSDTN